jgi:hypothetical protein
VTLAAITRGEPASVGAWNISNESISNDRMPRIVAVQDAFDGEASFLLRAPP